MSEWYTLFKPDGTFAEEGQDRYSDFNVACITAGEFCVDGHASVIYVVETVSIPPVVSRDTHGRVVQSTGTPIEHFVRARATALYVKRWARGEGPQIKSCIHDPFGEKAITPEPRPASRRNRKRAMR